MTNPLFAHVNGVRLAYERRGSGFPILLIHGFPRDRRLWRPLVSLLEHRFDCVALDRRGYGESDRPADPAGYDNATMARDALAMVRHLGWQRFLVVGHDLGQPVAQRLAADYPAAVSGAVFLDSMPQGVGAARQPDPNGRTWYLDFFRQRGVAERLIGQNPRLFFSLFLARHPHLTEAEHEAFLEPFCRPGSTGAVLADYRHMLEDDRLNWEKWVNNGKKIAPPVCALWGGRGPLAGAAVLESWQRVAATVEGSVIQESAHYVQEEQPHSVANEILRFASSLELRQ